MALADVIIKDKDGNEIVKVPGSTLRDIANTIGSNINVKGGGGDDAPQRRTPIDQTYDYAAIQDFKKTALPGLTGVSIALKGFGDTFTLGGKKVKALADRLDGFNQTVTQTISVFQRQSLAFFRSFDKRIRQFRVSVKDSFGGLTALSDQGTNKLANSMIRSYDVITSQAASAAKDLTDNKLLLTVDTAEGEQQLNLINASLGGSIEVLQSFQSLVSNYADTVGPRFAEALRGQEFQVKRLEKGLGLSQANIADLLRRQIALTGEASTDMLDDVEKFSFAVADATGGNAKLIAQQTAQIIANVKDFGNVTVEEATRIAGAVQKAGIEFSTFNSMLGQFQNFESATRGMSDLTAVFGIHMDSMQLMMLANEDQEEFLYRIKEGFESQGLAMEDMNLAQKRVLADTMSMSVEQAELFFQEGALPDQAEMEQASLTANAEQAVKRLNSEITNLIDQGKSIDEIVTMGVDESFLKPLEKSAFFNANAIMTRSARVADILKDQTKKSSEAIMTAFKGIEEGFAEGSEDKVGKAFEKVVKDLGTIYEEGFKDTNSQIVKDIQNTFKTFSLGWWQPNVGFNSPSPLFGQPFYEGLVAAIPLVESDIQESFLAISDSMSKLVAETGLPSLLDDLNEGTLVATSIVGDGTAGVSQSIQVLNEAAVDNLPKMVEEIGKLNTLLQTHVNNVEEGVATKLNIDLKLDNDTLFKSMYNYRHTSGGTIQVDSGEIKA